MEARKGITVTQTAVNTEESFEDFFAPRGGGAPSFDFDQKIGNGVIGTIVKMEKVQQTKQGEPDTKLWFDAAETQPRMQLNVTLQTELRNWKGVKNVPKDADGNEKPADEDDGTRRVYLKFKSQQAVGEALRKAGATSPKLGGRLGLKLSSISPNPNGPGKIHDYEAVYEAPTGAEGFDFGGSAEAEKAPAAKPEAAPQVSEEPPF